MERIRWIFVARDSIPIVLSETEACRRQFGKERTSVTCCAVADDAIELHLNPLDVEPRIFFGEENVGKMIWRKDHGTKHIATRRIRPRLQNSPKMKLESPTSSLLEAFVRSCPRHAELAVAELGLQAARPQTSPSGGAKPTALLNHEELEPVGQKAYHSVSVKLAYLALDRPDIAFASKKCRRAVKRIPAPRATCRLVVALSLAESEYYHGSMCNRSRWLGQHDP